MSDPKASGEWTAISQGGKPEEPHDLCIDGVHCIEVGRSRELVLSICDAHKAALAADREKVKDFRAELHSALEANELLVQQLAEELEKSVDAVREVTLEHAEQSGRQIKEIRELRDQLAAEREAAEKLCKLYFEIAAEAIGENAVRQKTEDALARIKPAPGST